MATLTMKEAGEMTDLTEARRFLFTHWEGGGNTPPMLAVVRRLVARGHSVRVLSDPCNREEVEATGASFASWTHAYARVDKTPATDPLKDWEVSTPPALLKRLSDTLFVGPSLKYAQDTLAELERFLADAIVASEMLLGVMAAAESAGVPCVGLSANIYLFPLPGVPPFGPGLLPATNVFGRVRDAALRGVTMHLLGKGRDAFNATRRELGLGPLAHPFDQAARVTKHLVLTSAAFDFPTTALPRHVVYAGPELDDPAWVEAWESPWRADDKRPLVVAGFSTTYQNQGDVLLQVIGGLSGLDVRAVVTAGPAVRIEDLPEAPNVHVCRSAPHNVLLQEAAAVVTHCGHGTVIRTLAAGVPMVCMPMGRDQNDNAARVTARGAGVRLKPTARAEEIRASVRTVLETPSFRSRARELGRHVSDDARGSVAVPVLEEVAARSSVRRGVRRA